MRTFCFQYEHSSHLQEWQEGIGLDIRNGDSNGFIHLTPLQKWLKDRGTQKQYVLMSKYFLFALLANHKFDYKIHYKCVSLKNMHAKPSTLKKVYTVWETPIKQGMV